LILSINRFSKENKKCFASTGVKSRKWFNKREPLAEAKAIHEQELEGVGHT
jgi:hypothetical protein